ncbi:MAG: DNA adenine methylase [Candidatus Saelkia tenebricola]|nr:DNA adenine methylase [Candidatus Saelkia tenebricola]
MIKIKHNRNLKFHYSPLRYPGGKTFLFSFFDKVIKKNGLGNTTYIEPFAGGAGAALALLFLEKVERIVINDFDKAIYSFWKSAIFDSEKFVKKIFSTPITIKEWRRQKLIYKNSQASCFDLGFATFFLNRTNISGIINGGPIGGIQQKSKWKIEARFNKENLAERIHQLSLYKNRISVFNRDGVDLLNEYLNKENVFVYLDPPYYEKGAMLYLNHYKKEDHEVLAKLLNDNPDAFWLLTYDNKKEIKSLYPERNIANFTLNYNAYESRKGKEILISSDALVL